MSLRGPSAIFLFVGPSKLQAFGSSPWQRNRSNRPLVDVETGDGPLTSAHFAEVKERVKAGTDTNWFLGLPLEYFSLVNFQLPLAAGENLDQAIRYALLRHVSFDLDQVYLNYAALPVADQYLIQTVVAPKSGLLPVLEHVAAAGIMLSGVFPGLALVAQGSEVDGLFLQGGSRGLDLVVMAGGKCTYHAHQRCPSVEDSTAFLAQTAPILSNLPEAPSRVFLWDADIEAQTVARALDIDQDRVQPCPFQASALNKHLKSFAYIIDLVPRSVIRRKRVLFWAQVAGVVLLLLSVGALPLAKLLGKHEKIERLEQTISRVSVQAEQLQKVREENKEIVGNLESLASFVNSQPDMRELLKELTEILPASTWLKEFNFSKGWIRIQGVSDSATSVVEALEKSPFFSEASFDSPVTNTNNQEMFTIVAKIGE
jgi:general secretion pathway protein L